MPEAMQSPSFDRPFEIPWLARGLDWLTAHGRAVLAAGVILQFAVLLTMMISPLTTQLSGEAVLLRVVPVDPPIFFAAITSPLVTI